MRMRLLLSIIVLLSGATMVAPALGQTLSDQQVEVWKVIESDWKAYMEKDQATVDKNRHERLLRWEYGEPAPINKASDQKWNRYNMENTTTLVQELYPVGIVVHGNTAVAHYFYTVVSENKKGERRTRHGKYTDVLVKDDSTWRFLAWHGGDDSARN